MCVTRTFFDYKKKSSLLQQQLHTPAAVLPFWMCRRLLSLLLVICAVIVLLYLEEQQLPVECRDNSRKKGTNKQAEDKNKKKEEDDELEEEEEEEESSKYSDDEEEARGKGSGKRAEEKEEVHSKRKFSFCSNGLRDAVNAAILELAGEHYVANVLLTQFPSLSYVPILTCPTPVVPERSKSALDEKGDGRKGGGMGGGGERGRSSLGKDETTRENVTGGGGGASTAAGRSIDTAAGVSAGLPNTSPDHVDTLWPALNDIQPADLLHDVLNSGKLRVAGLGPAPPGAHDSFTQWHGIDWTSARRRWRTFPPGGRPLPSAARLAAKAAAGGTAGYRSSSGGTWEQSDGAREPTETKSVFLTQTNTGFNWGDEGDYTVSQPTGYFPTYLRAIAERISEHYGRPVEVVWSFFSSGKDCFRSVQRGYTHMTDIYFLAAYQKNSSSMWEHFSHTCPVSGSPNLFVTLKEYNIHSLQDLVRHIRMTANPRLRTIAYLSAGNYETIQHFFPAHTLAEVSTKEEAERRIAAKQVLGNIRTGSARNIPPEFTVVDLGLVLAQVPYFSRTDVPHCLYHQLLVREAARSSSRRDTGKDGNTGEAKTKKKQRSSAAPGAAWAHVTPPGVATAVAASLLLGVTTAAA